MSNPLRLYLIPSCGLKIEFTDVTQSIAGRTRSHVSDPVTCHFPTAGSGRVLIRYRLARDQKMKIPEIHDLQDIQGWMSPVSKVTLPPFEKGKLGIHKDAMYYSYIHPPENLAQKIIWKDVIWKDVERNQEDKKRKGEECTIIENHWAKEYCSILGAYAYFGKDKKLLQVNAISLKKTDYYVQLVGPFKPTKEGAANMRERDRVHPLTLEVFHECSYVAIGFSIAGETFRSKPICNGSTNGRHGAFIFYRDNGTALTYEIDDGQNYFNPAGKISSLQDAFAQTAKDNMEFVNDNFLPAVGADERFKKDVLRVLENKKKKDNNETLKKELKEIMNGLKYEIADGSEDGKKNMRKKNILHYACRAKCGKEAIEKLVGLWSTSILTQKDSIGWLPLHFACRYCAKDKDLIEYLIEQIEPYMIGLKELMSDDFNRWPLHVAINSKPSVAVIELLLKNETNTKVMEIKTKNLERYPIHIACNRGVDKIIFQKLLDSIKHMREMMNFKTVLGSTPLQLAIERGLESDIIDLLITKCNCKGSSSVHEFECTCISSLYSRYNGMVPLAHACFNKSSAETVRLLLDMDTENRAIDMPVTTTSLKTSIMAMDEIEGMLPIHLALELADIEPSTSPDVVAEKHANATKINAGSGSEASNINDDDTTAALRKIVGLLLQKEKLKERKCQYSATIFWRDKKDRVPLHIACLNSFDANIIEQLLVVDAWRETTHAIDCEECTPLHYACAREKSNHRLIELLLTHEEDFKVSIKKNADKKEYFILYDQHCAHVLDKKNRTPLFHAVKTESTDKVIALLLQPKQINLKGFGKLVDEVAEIAGRTREKQTGGIREKEIHGYLIDELSRRSYFCMMLLDIYYHAFALGVFVYSTEALIQNRINYGEIYMLYACVGIGAVIELTKVYSEGFTYFIKIWNLSDMISLALLFMSSFYFVDKVGVDTISIERLEGYMLAACGILRIVNLTIILRTTFVPFARFVGGIILIFYTLIPFFAVSFLLLLAFAYSFWMIGNRGVNCDTLTKCYYGVLQSFFAGHEDTNDSLDVLFGILIIVVLLNVVIAIVQQAWEYAETQTLRLFWTYRLDFLVNNHFLGTVRYPSLLSFCKGLEERIDGIEDIRFSDQIPWTEEPYSLIDSEDKYKGPEGYFDVDTAKKIKASRSFQADWYWVQQECFELDKENKDAEKSWRNWKKAKILLKFIFHCILYFALFIAGLLTCGWFWPKNLRTRILSIGLNGQNGDSRTK